MQRAFLVKQPLLPISLERKQGPAIASMRIAIFLALLTLAWADSLIKILPSSTQVVHNSKEKEKRGAVKITATPGIRYAPTNQQPQPQTQNYVAQYVNPQQLLQQYSTLPREYVQQSYQPQLAISHYINPPQHQQAHVAQQHQQQPRYQFIPKPQALAPLAGQQSLVQQHQQFVLGSPQVLAYAPHQQGSQLLQSAGHHGGYNLILPAHQQQGLGYNMQPIILLAIQSPHYDSAQQPLLNYQHSRGVQFLTSGYQQPYLPYPQQHPQLAYFLTEGAPHIPAPTYSQPAPQQTVVTSTPPTLSPIANYGQKTATATQRQQTPQYKA